MLVFTLPETPAPMAGRQAFRNTSGTLRGTPSSLGSIGQLTYSERDRFYADMRNCKVGFIVYSYETPVAWFVDAPSPYWVYIDRRFTPTTDRHQRYIRNGLRLAYQDHKHPTEVIQNV